MVPLFEKYCYDFAYKNLPREAYKDKRLMRNRQLVLSKRFADRYQQQTIEFLKTLKTYVKRLRCET
ncbi:hypothetical protein DRJ17_03100 [Candidatus Woesearchaeota archaeon]|nr:MAG: hypothetical protein DRJ17_03100 [Candidatus Woesearchaeota archaeon]